jgi:uncharacterized membrane protein SpoIIM required for sporulation
MSFTSGISKFFLERQSFPKYAIAVIVIFITGIILAYIAWMSVTPNISSENKKELLSTLEIPKNSFIDIFLGNLWSALIVLLLLGFSFVIFISIVKKLKQNPHFKKDLGDRDVFQDFKVILKFLALFTAIWYSFHSFGMRNFYVYFEVVPINIALLTYLHAIFEIPGMIIPSIMCLYSIDEIYEINQISDREISKKKIQKLALNLLMTTIIITVLLCIAAYIECYITPIVTANALNAYLSGP